MTARAVQLICLRPRPKRDFRARVRAARAEAGVKVAMQVPTVNRVSNRGKIS
jgi:hypothetical protein